jgi:hypothetical protein
MMMRNMSFMLTTQQILDRSKTVTRRVGWLSLKPGALLRAVEKGMGLKKGEHVVELGAIRVVDVRREPLCAMLADDCAREGFPEMTVDEFVAMFCRTHKGCTPYTRITRIEFEHVDPIIRGHGV